MRSIAFLVLVVLTSLKSYGQAKNVMYDKPVSEIWETFIDHLCDRGIGISNADKESGIILSTQQNYIKNWRYSGDDDSKNSKAFILLKKKSGLQPLTITGRIMIRCKAEKNGTRVIISLVDLEAMSDKSMDADWRYMDVSSSGVFENDLANTIK